jgi:hypothetical protein
MPENNQQNPNDSPYRTIASPWARFAIIFIIVLLLFFAIEIAPLHFGPAHLSWPDLIPEIRQRLARILLIAGAIGIVAVVSGGKKASGRGDR